MCRDAVEHADASDGSGALQQTSRSSAHKYDGMASAVLLHLLGSNTMAAVLVIVAPRH